MTTLTILTWNLEGSAGVDATAVAGVLREVAPDVVALQEVQRHQADDLATRVPMPHVRWAFKHWPITARPEGLAVLTPHSIERSRAATVTRGAPWNWRRRIVLVVRIDTGAGSLTVVDAHLSPHGAVEQRRAEARRVLAEISATHATPAIIVGDLNDRPGDGAHRVLTEAGYRDAWTEANGGGDSGATSWTPGDRNGRPPTQRLDHVLVPPGWDVLDADAGPGAPIESFARWSDHLPLVVRLRPPNGGGS